MKYTLTINIIRMLMKVTVLRMFDNFPVFMTQFFGESRQFPKQNIRRCIHIIHFDRPKIYSFILLPGYVPLFR